MDMCSETKAVCMEDWRALGFYYEYDRKEKCWLVSASKAGITKLCHIFKEFSLETEPGNIKKSKCLGPYMYFKIAASAEPVINENGIYGSADDLSLLADRIRSRLDMSDPADMIEINEEYSDANRSGIKILVKENGFDPASPDTQLFEN